ncbi:MAG TPA: peptidylprolyl isomerase, partial [Ignavibacteriaceae bacterium]|nr:peptidylprolyl isomerase [Ignavibacteriaceae bacterium]
VYAQFTPDDRQLAATTFTRNFDKVTCKEYLTSDNDEKVIAGLLSVSHSEDTAFVRLITLLPVEKFAREICFTLGQLGPCSGSTQYLEKLFHLKGNDPLINYYALIALGKTGDSTVAKELISEYNSADDKSGFNGISLTLYYLFTNGKIQANDARTILEKELQSSSSRQFEAAFSLYRVGPSPEEKELIVNKLRQLLNGRIVSEITERPIPYLLACLRKLQYFPDNYDLLVQLKSINDFQSRVEAIRSSAYYKFKNRTELDNYLSYLSDDNKNITREAASSLKNLKLDEELNNYLKLKMEEMLNSRAEMEKYTKGEILLSYLVLFPENFNEMFAGFSRGDIDVLYIYKACAIYKSSAEALKFLSESYLKEDLKGRLAILESILNFNQTTDETSSILYSALNSEEPALISSAADGIDSTFISGNKDSLSTIIKRQTESNLNNADYIESLISLETLAGKISDELQKSVLNQLTGSRLYSIKKFVVTSTGKSIHSISRDIDNFDEFWKNAFEYKCAEIITEKGSFTISFLSEYAPITAGNFCYLASRGFFNGQIFHRVVPGFVIQGGDPGGTGWGGPGYEITSEFSPVEYNNGIAGMASAGKDTEGSQWFITTGSYPHLDGRYTIFAEVLTGSDVVEKITQDDKILNIKLNR